MSDDFHEVQFPTDISYGSIGGPMFSTEVIVLASGQEKRNQNWTYPRERWDVAYGVKSKELLVTLIIIGVLSAIAIPTYRKRMEMDFAEKAEVELRTIYTAERLYWTRFSEYATMAVLVGVNYMENPNFEANKKFTYSIILAPGVPGATEFTAQAQRIVGGDVITIDEDGDIDRSGWTP